MFKWLGAIAHKGYELCKREIIHLNYWKKDAVVLLKYTGLRLGQDEFDRYQDKKMHLAERFSENKIAEDYKDITSDFERSAVIAYDMLNAIGEYEVITNENFEKKMKGVDTRVQKKLHHTLTTDSQITGNPTTQISYLSKLRYNFMS